MILLLLLGKLVKLLAHKKIVFVIVEGPSDDEALGVLFSRIYDKNSVYVKIMRYDITTQKGITPNNIRAEIGNTVTDYAASNHFTKEDFLEIIHIVDMDGAYIPDENIVENPEVTKPVYSLTQIETNYRAGIIARNDQKRKNIDRLCSCSTLWSIPYHAYYMSCNLDHALYGKLNSPASEKERDSYQFAKRYRNDVKGFLEFICCSDFSVMSSYKKSWEYIKTGLHSLERHTNLGLCFPSLSENKP